MTDISHAAVALKDKERRAELWEFRALLVATYPLFLTAEVARRALGRPGASGRSAFTQAYATAAATLACAFMG